MTPAQLARIPRRLYDPVGANGAPQHELLVIAAELTRGTPRSAFAGVTLDTHSGLVNLYLAGASSAARVAAQSRVPAAKRYLVRTHQVPRSLASLRLDMSQATTAIRGLLRHGVRVQSWWPDFVHGVIDVALSHAGPAEETKTTRALAGIPIRLSAAASGIKAFSLAGRSAASIATPACGSSPSSACDSVPWSGADFIANGTATSQNPGGCTSSWPMDVGSTYYLLTAGHCSEGSDGETWYNAGITDSAVFGDLAKVGTGSHDELLTGQLDAQLIAAAPVPDLWRGSTAGDTAASQQVPVTGYQTPPSGTVICADGAYDGEACGATVSANSYDGCVAEQLANSTATACDTMEADGPSGQVLSGNGDSGGPVYEMTPSGAVGVGIVTAGATSDSVSCVSFAFNGRTCSSVMIFTSLVDIMGKYGASLVPPVVNVANGGQFASEWNGTGSAIGVLGEPYSSWYTTGSGQEQPFNGTNCTSPNNADGSGSAIFWSQPTGTREVQGCIYQYYEAKNGPSGAYGFPSLDEANVYNSADTAAIGRVSYFAGSARPSCSTGSEPGDNVTTAAIYWNSAAGAAHGVNGCIFAEYHSVGEASGKLGFPIDEAHSVNGQNVQDFQNGTISGSNGSYSVSSGNWVSGAAVNTANDYPYETFGQFEHQNQGTDAWNEYYGQCDSFAAWKVYQLLAGSAAQHPSIPVPAVGWKPGNASVGPVDQNTWGNADNWGKMAASEHWAVNNAPAPGTIAWWNNSSADSAHGIGSDGHVGYVTAVYPDGSVTIASYNLRLNGEFSLIHLPYNGSATDTSFHMGGFTVPWPSGFIHVADGIDPNAALPAEPANGTVSFGYPTQVKVVGPGSPSTEYSLGNVWYSDPGHGEIGTEEYTHTNGASAVSTATYTPAGLAANACYQVDALVPDNYSDNPVAVYTVTDVNGTHMAAVNENVYTNNWAELGVYKANGSGGLTVRLDDRGTTGLYVAADAMRFWAVSCAKYADVAPIMRQSTISNAWIGDSGHGFFGAMQYTSTTGSLTSDSTSASWAATGLLPGACYEVSAYVPDNYSDNNAARYETVDNYWNVFWPQVNENAFTNAFAPLGTFVANGSGQITLALTNIGPSGQFVAADAAAFTPDPGCAGPAGTGIGWTYQSDMIGPGSAPGPFVTTNQWYSRLGHGYANHELWTYDNGSTADSTAAWSFTGSANTCYSVAAYIPDNYADNPQARYSVGTSTEGVSLTLNQQSFTNAFAHLATVHTGSNGAVSVHLDDTGPAKDSAGNPLYTAADAVEFVANGQGC